MLKDDQENKILIGSFLEASCRDAFGMDDSQVETAIDLSQTDSDENNNDYLCNHHDSLGIPIIHTNMPRSDPSKYFYASSKSSFECTRRLSGTLLTHRSSLNNN